MNHVPNTVNEVTLSGGKLGKQHGCKRRLGLSNGGFKEVSDTTVYFIKQLRELLHTDEQRSNDKRVFWEDNSVNT